MKVIWTLKALKTYFDVSDYLQNNWGDNVVRNFSLEVEKIIREIQVNPKMFEASKRYKKVRKGFVTQHNTLFYRVKSNVIELLIFWDNRQDDKKCQY
jgi:plasmid stabilization system protein ParE